MLATYSVLPALSGCLLAESPDYGETRQTPPIIEPLSIVPSPLYQFQVTYPDTEELEFDFRSDDAGEDLQAVIYLDYGAKADAVTGDRRSLRIDEFDIAHGPFDQPKKFSWQFNPVRGAPFPGCHTITVLLMHKSSWSPSNALITGRFEDDMAMVTWWFTATDPSDPRPPQPCPEPGGGDPP